MKIRENRTGVQTNRNGISNKRSQLAGEHTRPKLTLNLTRKMVALRVALLQQWGVWALFCLYCSSNFVSKLFFLNDFLKMFTELFMVIC